MAATVLQLCLGPRRNLGYYNTNAKKKETIMIGQYHNYYIKEA